MTTAPLISIRGLTKTFRQRHGFMARRIHSVHALDDVSLDLPRGRTIGVVGESGSGKSTLGRCILRLLDPNAGDVLWHENDGTETNVTALAGEALRAFRGRMQVVFQDPFHSLNPGRPIWQIVGEGLYLNHQYSAFRRPPNTASIRDRAAAQLEAVGLATRHLDRLPHEFSGGQRQRIAIARALIVEPEFVVCDEVTSALDTRTQARILGLLRELQARTGVTLLFISHDLHTVASICDEIAVMRSGRIIERGPGERLFRSPEDDYTRTLVEAVPNPDPRRRSFRKRNSARPMESDS